MIEVTPDWKHGFKVVRTTEHPEVFKSATRVGRELTYILYNTTMSPEDCGPISVFDTIEDAFKFRNSNGNAIVEILYLPSK